jgi:hypothetical protein
MRYRDAKNLHNGDQVIRKSDKTPFIVQDIEVFGQYKKVYIHCVDEQNARVSFYNDEVE